MHRQIAPAEPRPVCVQNETQVEAQSQPNADPERDATLFAGPGLGQLQKTAVDTVRIAQPAKVLRSVCRPVVFRFAVESSQAHRRDVGQFHSILFVHK